MHITEIENVFNILNILTHPSLSFLWFHLTF